GSRCTFHYTVEGWPEAECFGKVYARPRPPATQTLASLLASGFGATGRHRVPEVIAELPALRLVLLCVAPGVPAAELLSVGDLDAAARAGEWLGAFHAARVALPAVYSLRDPLAQTRRWCGLIARHAPALADHASALYARMRSARPPWPGDAGLIHGDYGAAHIFVAAETTTVIDWDSSHAGDHAEDAGRFIASLWHLAARGRITHDDATAAARRFRDAYAAAQPQTAARLPFYAALACLRKAARLARHGERERYHAEALLAAGMAELATDR
ncbi:MAG TPA: phosphotransferase, partial [Ktedonobacterales bacterium]|nr:phosphotransferase [Ktedonobacterales bacterium]